MGIVYTHGDDAANRPAQAEREVAAGRRHGPPPPGRRGAGAPLEPSRPRRHSRESLRACRHGGPARRRSPGSPAPLGDLRLPHLRGGSGRLRPRRGPPPPPIGPPPSAPPPPRAPRPTAGWWLTRPAAPPPII